MRRNLEESLKGRHLDPLSFQRRALRRKSIHAICPFSGRVIQSNQSLLANINVIFYRFESDQVFYVVSAGIVLVLQKAASISRSTNCL